MELQDGGRDLTFDEIDQLQEFLERAGATECEACGEEEWSFVVVSTLLQRGEQGPSTDYTIPVVPAICLACANVRLLSTAVAGIEV